MRSSLENRGGSGRPERAWSSLRAVLAVVVGGLLLGLLTPPTPARAQPDEQARIDVREISPKVVAADSAKQLTVHGTITNTGSSTLRDLQIRAQRGEPRATEAGVRRALRDNSVTSTQTRFTPVATSLRPGQSSGFTMRVDLSGGADTLGINNPGVYPMMLNVNGDLAGGARARLAVARFMLPVLSLPGQKSPEPPEATPITTLIPLVDYPRLEQLAMAGRPTVLSDDRLARSLAPGGRLFGLVKAVSDRAPAGSPLGNGLCFAIDPDLITTARAMANGYRVRQDGGGTVRGTGSEAAEQWLNKLRDVTKGRCVIALPYSDADVVALGRAGLSDLINGAFSAREVVRRELGVTPRDDVLWPIGGAMDEPAASGLADSGIGTMLMHPEALALPGDVFTDSSPKTLRLATSDSGYAPAARLIDPLLAGALNPQREFGGGGSSRPAPVGDATPSSQDALAALTFRATQAPQAGRTSIIAPPRRWTIGEQDLRGLLAGMTKLTKEGVVQPTTLPDSPSAPSEEPAAGGGSEADPEDSANTDGEDGRPTNRVAFTYPVTASTEEIPQHVLDGLAARNFRIGELFRAAEREPAQDVDPSAVTTPLRNGLLHGASSAWRGDPAAAREWIEKATDSLERVLGQVRINKFAGQITLTSSNSPIPVTVTNDLPVTVGVNLQVEAPPGIKVDDLGLLKIPANGSRPFWLETQVDRAGKFSVDITARTEGGTQLGETRRIQLDSNAYGTVPVIITISAAALLVLLSARRIIRRFRGNGATSGRRGASPSRSGVSTNRKGSAAGSGGTSVDGVESMDEATADEATADEATRPGDDPSGSEPDEQRTDSGN